MTKLSTSDYKLLEVDGREYVFLTGSQEIMEITNPLLIAYFNPTCESEAKGTNEETFDELTSALIVKRDAVHHPSLQYGMQLLLCFYQVPTG